MKKEFEFHSLGEEKEIKAGKKYGLYRADIKALSEQHFREKEIVSEKFWNVFEAFWDSEECNVVWENFQNDFIKSQGTESGEAFIFSNSQVKVSKGVFQKMQVALERFLEQIEDSERIQPIFKDGINRVKNQVSLILRSGFCRNFYENLKDKEEQEEWSFEDVIKQPRRKEENRNMKLFFSLHPGDKDLAILEYMRLHKQRIMRLLEIEENDFSRLLGTYIKKSEKIEIGGGLYQKRRELVKEKKKKKNYKKFKKVFNPS